MNIRADLSHHGSIQRGETSPEAIRAGLRQTAPEETKQGDLNTITR